MKIPSYRLRELYCRSKAFLYLPELLTTPKNIIEYGSLEKAVKKMESEYPEYTGCSQTIRLIEYLIKNAVTNGAVLTGFPIYSEPIGFYSE